MGDHPDFCSNDTMGPVLLMAETVENHFVKDFFHLPNFC
jgi:hypothetical protein